MVRNLRVEADRMHALACICRAALVVDLFGKESAHRGQRPVAGSDIGVSLFADPQVGGRAGMVAGGDEQTGMSRRTDLLARSH